MQAKIGDVYRSTAPVDTPMFLMDSVYDKLNRAWQNIPRAMQ
jgi:hypothetical protein